jgi:hypothetical protein
MIYPTNIPYLSKLGVNPSYIQFFIHFCSAFQLLPHPSPLLILLHLAAELGASPGRPGRAASGAAGQVSSCSTRGTWRRSGARWPITGFG